MEIFKEIKGYEGYYEVSNTGKIKSVRNNIILKVGLNPAGYEHVNLQIEGKIETGMIHRIVAETFLQKTAKYVNHKDSNKRNNNVENLEWVTNRENSYHFFQSVRGLTPGVQKVGKKYQVRIRINGEKKCFGRFTTIEDAIIIRDNVISELQSMS